MTVFGDLNLKIPSSLAISVFMMSFNFMLSLVEVEKSFITWRPVGDNFVHFSITFVVCTHNNQCSDDEYEPA